MNRLTYVLLRSVGLARPKPKTRFGRWTRRAERVIGAVGLVYVALHVYPQPLFAHTVTAHDITLYARHPISPQATERLAQARALVNRSELAVPHRPERVFLCDSPWLYRLFTPLKSDTFAVSILGTDHIFIAAPDLEADRATSSLGGQRPLTGVIAHEITHGLIRHRLGQWRAIRLPEWVVEGYCDTIARSSSFPEAQGRRMLATGQTSPSASFRYYLHRQMVTHLIDDRHFTFNQLVNRAGEGGPVQAEMREAIRSQ